MRETELAKLERDNHIRHVICKNCGFTLKIDDYETCIQDVEELVCCCSAPNYKYIIGKLN